MVFGLVCLALHLVTFIVAATVKELPSLSFLCSVQACEHTAIYSTAETYISTPDFCATAKHVVLNIAVHTFDAHFYADQLHGNLKIDFLSPSVKHR